MRGIGGWLDYQQDIKQKVSILQDMAMTVDNYQMYISNHIGLIGVEYEKDDYIIVFSGELYNKSEINNELGKEIDIDAEVVLEAYLLWGFDAFNKFNGAYAFSIYNSKTEELVLVRDHFGIKPLYYYPYDNGIVFGSYLKVLLKNPLVEPIITEDGLLQIFMLGPQKILGSGVFKDVKEIFPGQYVVVTKDGCSTKTYYRLVAKEHTESLDETKDKIKELLEDSVKRRIEPKMGTMLSGGLDSSVVSSLANKYVDSLSSYYIEYKDNDKYFKETLFQPNQDKDYIQIMVDELKSEHRVITLNEDDLFDHLYESMAARDLPGMADIDSSFYVFCKEISKNESVVLSGECSDEVFGGYPWYYKEEFVWKDSFPWMQSIDVRKQLVKEGILKNEESYIWKLYNDTLVKVSYLPSDNIYQRRHRELFYLNVYWFMQTLMERCERMSSVYSLNVRIPFCDKRLVEYCYNIPVEMKLLNGSEKGLLKETMKDILPKEIANRKKSPFPKTWNPRYFELLVKRMNEVLQEDSLFTYVINKEMVEKIMLNEEEIMWYGQLMRTPQVIAYLLQVDMWFKEYNVRIEV